jgi:hypothetical protein
MISEKDKEMMDVMARGGKKKANPQVAKAKADLIKMMKEYGVSSEAIIQLGKAGEMVLTDKSLYPMFLNKAIELGLADAEGLNPAKPDYQVIASMITSAKLLEEY